VKNALEATQLRSENETLKKEVLQRRRAAYHDVVGESQRMQDLMSFVNKVASSEATTILIQGESGTGKDLISRAIHFESRRKDKPLIIINCSAIPETLMETELFGHEKGAFTDAKGMKKGLFEQADGGTLFLDEIGELSGLLQAKLLRVLEEQVIRRVGGARDQEVDVRVIAASNRDLERAVREGTFRQDLYYRLAIISLFLPPLRDRREDILPLVHFFIERYNRRFRKSVEGISPETRELLVKYDWPGNVRELKNAIERAMILEDDNMLRPDYLPFSVGSPLSSLTAFEHSSGGNVSAGAMPSAQQSEVQVVNGKNLPRLSIPEGGTSLEEIERTFVEMAMQQASRNQTLAAKLLDISRDALRYKLKKFGLMHGEEGEAASSPH
jgi:transcriptional regulator with PAS, ATPase and Fis domain